MKNALLIWNVILTLATGYLLIQQFGGGSKKAETADAAAPAFKIAYFEMDSIENNYQKVKDVKKEIADKDEHYSSEVAKLEMEMNRTIQGYQQKQNSGTMTEQDFVNAQNHLKRLETKLKGDKQLLDNQYQDFILRRNLDVRKQIEDYIARYNKEKGYSYIVAYEPGLFYYRDTMFNITEDLVKGLNAEYKKD